MAWKTCKTNSNLEMDSGDFGVVLPFTVKGTTVTASDCFRFVFKGADGATILTQTYADVQNNTINFVLSAAESALFPVGSYLYDLEWYQDGAFQDRLISSALFRVV